MSPIDTLALFAVMVILAALPGASVLLVISQTLRHGRHRGYWTVAGIVAGDLLLLAIAMFGLSEVSSRFETGFSVFRIIAALYLLWTGWQLLRSAVDPVERMTVAAAENTTRSSTGGPAAFLGAFALTVGDIKALMFYASLLPSLINLQTLALRDAAVLLILTIIAVGTTKCLFVHLAQTVSRSGQLTQLRRYVSPVAGIALMATGGYLLTTAMNNELAMP